MAQKQYLKMADVFINGVESDCNHPFVRDLNGYDIAWVNYSMCDDRSKAARYAAHAINSHDELVAEVERLRGEINNALEKFHDADLHCQELQGIIDSLQ